MKWLLRRAVNGEFPLEAAGVEDSPNIALQGVEQDVAASLAMLLGMGSMTQDPLWDSAVLRRRSEDEMLFLLLNDYRKGGMATR